MSEPTEADAIVKAVWADGEGYVNVDSACHWCGSFGIGGPNHPIDVYDEPGDDPDENAWAHEELCLWVRIARYMGARVERRTEWPT